jgi:hypothetical protein
MILSAEFTSFYTECGSNPEVFAANHDKIQIYLQPPANDGISPFGSLLVSSIFY